MANLDTVGSQIGRDFAHVAKAEFLRVTDIFVLATTTSCRPATTRRPTCISLVQHRFRAPVPPRFALSVEQLRPIERMLKEHRLEHDVLGLIEFIKAGIEGREYAKFVFTRSLSDALSLIGQLGRKTGCRLRIARSSTIAAIRVALSRER